MPIDEIPDKTKIKYNPQTQEFSFTLEDYLRNVGAHEQPHTDVAFKSQDPHSILGHALHEYYSPATHGNLDDLN